MVWAGFSLVLSLVNRLLNLSVNRAMRRTSNRAHSVSRAGLTSAPYNTQSKNNAFRHAHSALLLDSADTPKVVQGQLRRSGARTTLEIYGHVVGDAPENRPEYEGFVPRMF
jgi:integrase